MLRGALAVLFLALSVVLVSCTPTTGRYAEPQAAVDRWAADITSAIAARDVSELHGSTTTPGFDMSRKLIGDDMVFYLISGRFHATVLDQPDAGKSTFNVCLEGEDVRLASDFRDGLFAPTPVQEKLVVELVERDGRLLVHSVESSGHLYCRPPLRGASE